MLSTDAAKMGSASTGTRIRRRLGSWLIQRRLQFGDRRTPPTLTAACRK